MAALQPINEWFGINPVYKPTKEIYTREQRRKAKEAVENIQYVDGPGITDDEAWFRHHNWSQKRSKVRQALYDAGSSQNSLNSFDNCGSDTQVEWNAAEKRYRVCGCYCHNRHCEPCMRAKSSLIIGNLRAILNKAEKKQHRFLTLTLTHDKATPLKSQIKRLYAAYKQLRATTEWKATQKGGAATLEIKWAEPGYKKGKDGRPYMSKGGWHPHLHIISEGTALDQYVLSDLWYRCTGDSFIVDIRIISADKDVAYYVGKYVTKGTNDDVWSDPLRAAEWVKAVKGVRMCATFGTWRGYKLLARKKEVAGTWEFVASLDSLARRARSGETKAIEILMQLEDECMYDPNRKRSPKPK